MFPDLLCSKADAARRGLAIGGVPHHAVPLPMSMPRGNGGGVGYPAPTVRKKQKQQKRKRKQERSGREENRKRSGRRIERELKQKRSKSKREKKRRESQTSNQEISLSYPSFPFLANRNAFAASRKCADTRCDFHVSERTRKEYEVP